ncbi:MAG: hypothetical protein AUI42_04685 [Actinobacteria bacterium 13_1_40CM_2_65_8]|nr:MAG: hypothetical protein AUI42_04685 [Actinobacteria bacterium 13_1_40CM_2_65_8]
MRYLRRDSISVDRSRKLRREQTAAEKRIWSRLRGKRFLGYKFRRQHAIGTYIVDFACLRSRLVIEIDGDSHGEDHAAELDGARTAWLQTQGLRVLRFWNHSVIEDIDSVMESVYYALECDAVPAHAPLPDGEREFQRGSFANKSISA